MSARKKFTSIVTLSCPSPDANLHLRTAFSAALDSA